MKNDNAPVADRLAAKKAELAALDKPGFTGMFLNDGSNDEAAKDRREALLIEIADLQRQVDEAPSPT